MAATLRGGTALYGSAVLVDRLLALLLLPLLTRAIGAQDYGAWVQTLAGAGLLLPVVLFALPTAIVRSFSADATALARRRQFRRLGAVVAGLGLGVAALALLTREPLAQWIYGDRLRQSLVPALLGVLVADAAVEFATAWLRAAGRMGLIAAVLMARSALRYAVVWALVIGGDKPIADWLGPYAASQAALALAVLVLGYRALRTPAVPAAGADAGPPLRALIGFSAPLVALALFTALNASFDRFLLVQMLGLNAVAVYAAAASLCGIPAVFYAVIGFALFPVLARHWAEARRDEAARLTDEALQAFLFLCLPVTLALAITGPWLLPWVTTSAYRAPTSVFALLGVSVAAFGLYQILLYALLLAGRSRQVLALAAAAAALNLVLNLTLTPRWGLPGAAAAAAVSNTLMVTLAARQARQVMAWSLPRRRLWAVVWRAAVAAAPLAWLAATVPADAPLPLVPALVGAALGAVVYIGLDWLRPGSVTRRLLPG